MLKKEKKKKRVFTGIWKYLATLNGKIHNCSHSIKNHYTCKKADKYQPW